MIKISIIITIMSAMPVLTSTQLLELLFFKSVLALLAIALMHSSFYGNKNVVTILDVLKNYTNKSADNRIFYTKFIISMKSQLNKQNSNNSI